MLSKIMGLMDCRPFRGRVGPEDRLAMEVASYLRAATLEGKLLSTWTHIPHEIGGGGIAAKVRMALAKAMGLIAGTGDYVFVWVDGGGWIEMKTKTGSLSPAQRDHRDWCLSLGVKWAMCRSLHEVINTLEEWGVLRSGRGG